MCGRHSFIVTRAGKVFHGLGLTDSHTTIREFAGLSSEDDSVNSYEWQPPDGWPDADWMDGLTKDTEVWEPKKKHLLAMEGHIRRLYPSMDEWNTPDRTATAAEDGSRTAKKVRARGIWSKARRLVWRQ